MAQVNFRIDDNLKKRAEAFFSGVGMTMSGAITVFIQQTLNRNAIPFEVRSADPDAKPMSELLERIDDVKHGRNCHFHELVEVDDEAAVAKSRTAKHGHMPRRRRCAS